MRINAKFSRLYRGLLVQILSPSVPPKLSAQPHLAFQLSALEEIQPTSPALLQRPFLVTNAAQAFYVPARTEASPLIHHSTFPKLKRSPSHQSPAHSIPFAARNRRSAFLSANRTRELHHPQPCAPSDTSPYEQCDSQWPNPTPRGPRPSAHPTKFPELYTFAAVSSPEFTLPPSLIHLALFARLSLNSSRERNATHKKPWATSVPL